MLIHFSMPCSYSMYTSGTNTHSLSSTAFHKSLYWSLHLSLFIDCASFHITALLLLQQILKLLLQREFMHKPRQWSFTLDTSYYIKTFCSDVHLFPKKKNKNHFSITVTSSLPRSKQQGSGWGFFPPCSTLWYMSLLSYNRHIFFPILKNSKIYNTQITSHVALGS